MVIRNVLIILSLIYPDRDYFFDLGYQSNEFKQLYTCPYSLSASLASSVASASGPKDTTAAAILMTFPSIS